MTAEQRSWHDLGTAAQRVLAVVYDWVLENGQPPTVRHITDACGYLSTATAHAHLQNLERAGWLVRSRNSYTLRYVTISDERPPWLLEALRR